MKLAALLFLTISMSLNLAKAEAPFVCDRQKVQQLLLLAKAPAAAPVYAKIEKHPASRPVSPRLNRIFRKVETAAFGRHFMAIENFTMLYGATLQGNRIQFSSMTDELLKSRLQDPDLGAAFEMAHEMGHLIQKYIGSPVGLPTVSPDNELEYHKHHVETDCIAAEIIYQAGYPLNEEISKTLTTIKVECITQQVPEFCERGDHTRQAAMSQYISSILSAAKP
jgi:hypothetical protein